MIITEKTLYYFALFVALYLTAIIISPICYCIKNKINVKRYLFPTILLLFTQTSSILFLGFMFELLTIGNLIIPFILLALTIAAICFIIPNLIVYFVSVRRKKIKIYEWFVINCYVAIPVIAFILWGCI